MFRTPSRSGNLAPVAVFDSVEIDGVERFLVRKEDVEAVIGGIEENVFNYN